MCTWVTYTLTQRQTNAHPANETHTANPYSVYKYVLYVRCRTTHTQSRTLCTLYVQITFQAVFICSPPPPLLRLSVFLLLLLAVVVCVCCILLLDEFIFCLCLNVRCAFDTGLSCENRFQISREPHVVATMTTTLKCVLRDMFFFFFSFSVVVFFHARLFIRLFRRSTTTSTTNTTTTTATTTTNDFPFLRLRTSPSPAFYLWLCVLVCVKIF